MTPLLNAGIGLFAVVITLPALYLAFLGAVTLVARPKTPVSRRGTGSLGFAILVPAHNEAELVGGTVDRLLRLRHPADRVSVHVVADNCTDDTAAVAREHGACVHERTDARRRGKGAALNWLADQVFSEIPRVDAFVVVDADSELSNDFVGVMSDHLRAGAQTIQVSDQANNTLTASTGSITVSAGGANVELCSTLSRACGNPRFLPARTERANTSTITSSFLSLKAAVLRNISCTP